LWAADGSVYALAANQLFRCDAALARCRASTITVAAPDVAHANGEAEVLPLVAFDGRGGILIGVRLPGLGRSIVLRSIDAGQTWRIAATVPQAHLYQIWIDDSRLYVLGGSKLFVGKADGKALRPISDLGMSSPRVILGRSRKHLFVATESGNDLTLLELRGDTVIRQPLLGKGIDKELRALWIDAANPRVIVALTGQDILWSSDGGNTFQPGKLSSREGVGQLTRVFDLGDTRVVSSSAGLYRLRDRIPRKSWVEARFGGVLAWFQTRWKETWFRRVVSIASSILLYLVGILILLYHAWRGGSVVLTHNRFTQIFTKLLIDLPRLSRFALFAGYSRRVRRGLRSEAVQQNYFGLPAKGPAGEEIQPSPNGLGLIGQIAASSDAGVPVVIEAGGGAGKSTLLDRIAWLALNKGLPEPWNKLRPVLVPSRYFTTTLTDAITAALRQRGVNVTNETILRQLERGGFLILFDGASEIEAQDKVSATNELLHQATSHEFSRSRIIVTTRPQRGRSADYPTFQLLPVRADHLISAVLPKMELNPQARENITRALGRFGDRPITPMLFRMAVETSADGSVTTATALYERYFRSLLKIGGSGDNTEWAGWITLLSHVAKRSLLDTGNRGVGVDHGSLMKFLSESTFEGKELASVLNDWYGIKTDLLESLQHATSAGILAGSGTERWRFSHDQFEEYFAGAFIAQCATKGASWKTSAAWTSDDERISEFVDVLEFAIQMANRQEILDTAPDDAPESWISFLEGHSV
jgi:hypothetical protein